MATLLQRNCLWEVSNL